MKKLLFFLIFFSIIILVSLSFIFIKKEITTPNTFGITDEFKINKILYYSSANAVSNTTSFQSPEWDLTVYQYTDVAIYLERLNPSNELKYQNYITKISLENFATESLNTKVYYLNPKNFGNSELNSDDLIEDNLEYTVINSDNADDAQNYNIPIFFQDCSNPITLRIVTELSNNYQVSSDRALVYNGSLIKELGLGIENLNKNLNFDISIYTRGSVHHKNVNIDIPYENNKNSIFDGDITIETKENINF